MTKRKFSMRFSELRDYAKLHKIEEPSGLHFSLAGHSFNHLQGLAVEKVKSKDPFILRQEKTGSSISLTATGMA